MPTDAIPFDEIYNSVGIATGTTSASASIASLPTVYNSVSDPTATQSLTAGYVTGDISSANFQTGVAGWKLSYLGNLEANNGNFRGDLTGATGTFSGTLTGGSLNVPDLTTANSFHTDNSGNSWWGCNVANFVSNHNNATAYILNTGVTKFATALSGASIVANGSTLVLYDDSVTGNPVTGATAQVVFADTSDATQQMIINKRKSIYSSDDNVLEIYSAKTPNNSRYNWMFMGKKGDDTASTYYTNVLSLTTKQKFALDHYNSANFSGSNPHLLWSIIASDDIAVETGVPIQYVFTVSGITVTPTSGAVYSNNTYNFTVVSTSISVGSGTITTRGTGVPSVSGTLAKVSGTGDSSISFSSKVASNVQGDSGGTRQVMMFQSASSYSPYNILTGAGGGGMIFGYFADSFNVGQVTGTQVGGGQMFLDVAGIHNYDFVDFSNASDFGGRATISTDPTLGYGVDVAEPYWSFTKVDPNSRFTVVPSVFYPNAEIDFTGLTSGESAYIYKDMSTNYFSSDFTHILQFNVSSTSNTNEVFSLWSLTNDVGDWNTLYGATKPSLSLLWNRYSSRVYWLEMIESSSAGAGTSYNNTLAPNTDYYLTIVRNETVGTYGTLYCYIYTDSGRTTLLGGTNPLTITLHAKLDLRYLYAIQSISNGSGSVSGYVKNLVLVSNPSDIIIPSQTAVYNYIKNLPASVPTWSNGEFSKDASSTTTTTIAHGLGRTPKKVKLTAILNSGITSGSLGTFDSSGQNCLNFFSGATITRSVAISLSQGTGDNDGTVTVNGTNITITWNKLGSPTGTFLVLWEAT